MQLGRPPENALAQDIGHRPWNPPRAPWVMFQSWRDVLFIHWPIAARVLRPLVPPQLSIEVFDSTAWLSLTPLEMRDVHLRGLPPVPGLSRFPELNLRTYVRHRGKPGVFFFSLDTTNWLATASARGFFRLPYRKASMQIERRPEGTHFESHRPGAEFVATYRPIGGELEARPGSLEYFLIERYALYSTLPGRQVLRGEIHHRPWRLHSAVADVEHDNIARAHGIELPDIPPILHYAERQDTLVWAPLPSRTGARLVPAYG
ncbi:MAG: DUF2071 domain-containing protein [Polyangiaceae bacterium]|nr:DUF2071 domain-containing protein [Polyangiaceae bacterium]